MDIRLPHLAEGADSGTVVNVLVSEGQAIQKGETLLELENQKAVAPIPATASGKVTKVHVKQGDQISVGQVLVSIEEGAGAGAAQGVASPTQQPVPDGGARIHPGTEKGGGSPGEKPGAAPVPQTADYLYRSESGAPPPAGPEVRKMAQEMGIDLRRVKGSERGGRITAQDVRAYMAGLQARSGAGVVKPAAPPVDFAKWGPVTREPFSSLRKAIARAMTDSWTTIPHVTQFDQAEIARALELIEKHGPSYEKKGAKLTLTGVLIKVIAATLKKHPGFNSSLDEAAGEIVRKGYVNIGIAVDTEQGLIVPVLKDADKKTLLEISKELADLADRTRKRKIAPEELQGGTFTISNQGGIGGGHFTPIIHKPEVAILGVGRAVKGALPLSLSYDHRVVDGADAARFITELVRALEHFPEPEMSLRA